MIFFFQAEDGLRETLVTVVKTSALRMGAAGQRTPPHYPNALRVLVAEEAAEAGRVVLLATDVDDMSPEYVEPLRQAGMAAGALDVQTWPGQMKKGRQGFRVEVMAPGPRAQAVPTGVFPPS